MVLYHVVSSPLPMSKLPPALHMGVPLKTIQKLRLLDGLFMEWMNYGRTNSNASRTFLVICFRIKLKMIVLTIKALNSPDPPGCPAFSSTDQDRTIATRRMLFKRKIALAMPCLHVTIYGNFRYTDDRNLTRKY